MPIKKLTAENAVITTATVEVKTLTLSGKQITLSVFRQLPEQSPFYAEGDYHVIGLKGSVWGYVNYHPDKCAKFPEHDHVVWQHDQILKRARIYAPWVVTDKLHHANQRTYVVHANTGTYYPIEVIDDPVLYCNCDWQDRLGSERSLKLEAEYKAWQNRYEDLYRQIFEVDQLYIAVG